MDAERLAKTLLDEFGEQLRITTPDGSVIINHGKAQPYLGKYTLATNQLQVALMAAFENKPDLDGAELEEAGRKALAGRMEHFTARGYSVDEVEGTPGVPEEYYDKRDTPTVIQYLSKKVSGEEISEEVRWLIEEMPTK